LGDRGTIKNKRFGRTLHVDGHAIGRAAIDDAVVLDSIAIAGEVFAAFGPKEHADLRAVQNFIARHEIVRVAVANGDTDPVADQLVVFRQAILHTPAEEDPDIVPLDAAVANNRPLRTGTRMQAQTGMVFRNAVLDEHIMANLPTDAVAVVVARLHTADGDTTAILEKNAAGVVAVEVVVVRLVPVEREILDDD